MTFLLIYHHSVRAELRQRVACVALEIAVEVALVGEVEFVYQLLEALVCVYEAHLQLNDCKVVDNLLCVLSAGALANRI